MSNQQIHTSWIIALLSLLLVGACSKSSDLTDDGSNEADRPKEEIPEQKVFPFLFSAKKTVLNIFDLSELSILDSAGGSLLFGLDELAGSYDSIVWHVKGLEGRLRIFKKERGNISLTSSWGHCFYLPGSYEAYLSGYKGKQIIHSDSLQMEVTDGKSFLGRNWSDTDNLGNNVGFQNALNKQFVFATIANVHNTTPTIDLRLTNSENIEESLFYPKQEKELYAYMVQLYGKPLCEKDSPELADKYKTFEVRSEQAVPLAFWLTSKAKIILLKKRHDVSDNRIDYHIHAEPIQTVPLSAIER